jgi:hypothetical protein
VCLGSASTPAASAAGPPRGVALTEGLPAFVHRLEVAVGALKAGDCAAWNLYTAASSFPETPCNPTSQTQYATFRLLGFRRFGTGALVEFSASEVPTPVTWVLTVFDHRFSSSTLGYVWREPGTGPLRSLGSTPTRARLSRFNRTAADFVDAVRSRDCNLLWTTVLRDDTKAKVCAKFFAQTRPDLLADPSATPVRMGGTRDWQFYRLLTSNGRYRTLVVGRIGAGSGLYDKGPLYQLTSERASPN